MILENKILKDVLYTNEEIVQKCKDIAEQLNTRFEGEELVVVPVMSGGLPFTLELIKHLTIDVYIDYVWSSSYEFDKKISEPKIKYDASIPLTGKNVLIIDDVIDSGETIEKITEVLGGYGAKTISVAGLVVKPQRIKPSVTEYIGWEYEGSEFLIGFGLDWDEKLRNLPYIGTVDKTKV